MRRPGIFFLVKHLHASMPRSWSYGRNQAAASHVQLRITQRGRPLHVGVASIDSLAASDILHSSNHFTHKFFIPMKVFGQINNRIARDKGGEPWGMMQNSLGRRFWIPSAAAGCFAQTTENRPFSSLAHQYCISVE